MVSEHTQTGETLYLPSAFIYKCSVPEHEEIKSRLLPKIIKTSEDKEGDPDWGWAANDTSPTRSNWGAKERFFDYFTEADINTVIWQPIREMLRDGLNLGKIPDNFSLKSIWWNRYPPGASAPAHVHDGSLAGVYLLEQDETCPLNFLYVNPFSLHPNGGGEIQFAPDAKEGDVLLFPARLVHWVAPTKKHRASVSFNLNPSF